MNNYDYKRLTPFKWFVLQNFPFIDEDFDAITNYQLFCKLGEEINKIINSQNLVGEQVETLTTAFNNLKDYVDNYFNNLDVQDEINNKLDDMAESGQLTDIIAQYLQLAGILAFNTKAEMKSAENLVDGSFAKTYGTTTYNDGYGHFYKIRTLLNTDVIDDINIIALTNYPTLIAELIPDAEINNINSIINRQLHKKIIVIGDSYSHHEFDDITSFWYEQFATYLGLTINTDLFVRASDGAGFANDAFYNRLYDLRNIITNKSEITDILIVGGFNDRNATESTLLTKMTTFNNYAKETYPNAKISLCYVGNTNPKIRQSYENRDGVIKSIKYYERNSGKLNWEFLKNTCYILHNYDETYWEDDGAHPSQLGQNVLGTQIAVAFINGFCDILEFTDSYYTTAEASGIATNMSNASFISGISNETSYLKKSGTNTLNFTIDSEQTINCQGNTAYELATLSNGFYMGNGNASGTTVPIIISGTIGGVANTRVVGVAQIYCEYGKLKIVPLAYNNNTAINTSGINTIFIPNFHIITESYYA